MCSQRAEGGPPMKRIYGRNTVPWPPKAAKVLPFHSLPRLGTLAVDDAPEIVQRRERTEGNNRHIVRSIGLCTIRNL